MCTKILFEEKNYVPDCMKDLQVGQNLRSLHIKTFLRILVCIEGQSSLKMYI